MKKTLPLLLLFLPCWLFAQYPQDSLRDKEWLTGYGDTLQPWHRYSKLTFNSSDVNVTTVYNSGNFANNGGFFRNTCANICDTSGHLLLYTNGILVMNNQFDTLVNGSGLNPGYWADNLLYGYALDQGALILPYPNHQNQYYIFHTYLYDNIIDNDLRCTKVLYSIADMSLYNGRGALITKNQPLLVHNYVEYGKLSACRHANGRDWWIMLAEANTNRYRAVLLDASGVHLQNWQTVGDSTYSGVGQSCFSPDGTKYARCNSQSSHVPTTLDIYDFDRCEGLLSNHRQQQIMPDSVFAFGGLAISANSRYLYVSGVKYLFRYDLNASNIIDTKDTVAIRDGNFNTFGYSSFRQMQLASNGKIYITTLIATKTLHTINTPDEANCNVIQRGQATASFTADGLPNYPNFRLGPVDGSVCDSLGIDNIVVATIPQKTMEDFLNVFPNPASDILNVEISPPIQGSLYLYNALGQQIKQINISNNQSQLTTYDIPNGIYFLSVLGASGRLVGRERVVVQHE
jgi:hypothetical protein